MRHASLALLLALLAVAHPVRAQSALSTQGFGYPTGGLSVRALTVGGSTGDLDPLSVLNPATLANWGPSGIAAQFSPERRRVTGDGSDATTTTVRFPVYTAGINLVENWQLGLSASTFLDRTWATSFTSVQQVEGQTVESTTSWASEGAINDVRIGLGHRLSSALQLGAAFHVFTGNNDVTVATDFTGSDFQDLQLISSLGYSGTAFSAGLVFQPTGALLVGLSARMGGDISVRRNSQSVSEGSVPDRVGASVVYSGLGSATLSARYEQVSFSQMTGLGSAETVARDSRDMGVGLEFSGPTLLGNSTIVRLGGRERDLPFEAAGAQVKERSFSGGLGIALAGQAAMLDFGLVRSSRTNSSVFRESAWTFATGILVRP